MEDEKLAAYYDELTHKGGGAARFKQGLGFSSSSNDAVPARGSALPSATPSSFLSSFVRSSSPSKTEQFDKQAQLQSIQNKLTKKPQPKIQISARDSSRSPNRNSIRKRSRSRDRYSRRRRSKSRSRSRSRDRYSNHRRRSRGRERQSRHNYRSRSRSKEKNVERRKRGGSPEERRLEKGGKRNGSGIDFAKLIEGYDHMTPAERVKAKMKFQLSKTAENDETIGQGSGWERFDFDKDAPLDDEEIEAVEDDAALVKLIGQSFRFSAVEARKEEQIKAAHDEAMFGASSHPPPTELDSEAEAENDKKQNTEVAPLTNLLSDQVLIMQQGSWRDRARKP